MKMVSFVFAWTALMEIVGKWALAYLEKFCTLDCKSQGRAVLEVTNTQHTNLHGKAKKCHCGTNGFSKTRICAASSRKIF